MPLLLKDLTKLLIKRGGDSHLHTNWTDGDNTIDEMIRAGQTSGLKWIIFSEHNRENSEYSYKEFCKEIQDKSNKYKNITLISGAECKIKNFSGELDISKEAIDFSDIITGVVHRFPGEKGNILKAPKNSFSKNQRMDALYIEKELMMAGIRAKSFSILGHPFGMTIRRFGLIPRIEYFEELMIECKKNNIIFELNYKYHEAIMSDLVNLLERLNINWTIGSNSHSSQELINSWNRIKKVNSNLNF